MKTKKTKTQHSQEKGSTFLIWGGAIILVVILAIFAFATFANNNKMANDINFPDIHGLGYKNNGNSIYVPSHDGLRVFANGEWKLPEGEKNDYMGFSMVDDGFYSSGHPGSDSDLENPFGIVKSNDFGKSLKILDLYKEVDFHGMAVGYYSHAIYVLNSGPNSRMEETGLYYTLDDTKTWTKSEMEGIEGQIASIAVHPTDEKMVTLGTNQGAFLSTDYGNSFESILPGVPTSAIHFTNDNQLIVGGIEDESVMYAINLDTKDKTKISIPQISKEDAITYIAVNPKNSLEIVFTTFEKQIFLTENRGNSWGQIAKDGTAIDLQDDKDEETNKN